MKRFSPLFSDCTLFRRQSGPLLCRGGCLLSCLTIVLLWSVGSVPVEAQSGLRLIPSVSQPALTERGGSLAIDSTPVPAPTGRTTVRFGSPNGLSTMSAPSAAAPPDARNISETFPNLVYTKSETPEISTPLRLQTDVVAPPNPVWGSLPAPQPQPLPPPVDREELRQVLRYGVELETEARWADVLTHYETALRIYRNEETLMQRFRVARFHYDIGRRFHDSSYLKMIHATNFIDALALYEEIITRIQTNYVDMPHWDELFRHGVQDVEIALNDPFFRTKANLNAMPNQIEAFLETMRSTADGWEIRNREDLKNGVLRLSEIAMQQIGVNPVVVLMEFTCGIVNSLDPYTAFLTPNQLADTFSMISGNFVGLGVELKSDRESLLIVRVIQGSPALEAGLRDGDRIHSVDDVPTKGKDTDSAADLLQGKEGTTVKLVVQSPGERRMREVVIMRRMIDVPSVEDVRMLNESLGYVKLTGFQSKTCLELKKALVDLHRLGMRCLVLDLRHNPGGLLQIGVEVANLFIEEGAIVRTRGRHSSMDTPYMATRENTSNVPLIVLIDEESASASEIVAGAIRDHHRGVIVGKRSYGKGTIQQILPVNGSPLDRTQSGLRLTVEKFYSPQGWPYSGVGVTPNVSVDTEHRMSLARPIQGRLQIPIVSRTVSSAPDDPFIRKAIETSRQILPDTAMRN